MPGATVEAKLSQAGKKEKAYYDFYKAFNDKFRQAASTPHAVRNFSGTEYLELKSTDHNITRIELVRRTPSARKPKDPYPIEAPMLDIRYADGSRTIYQYITDNNQFDTTTQGVIVWQTRDPHIEDVDPDLLRKELRLQQQLGTNGQPAKTEDLEQIIQLIKDSDTQGLTIANPDAYWRK